MKDNKQTLAELFTDMAYSLQVICDDFADATGKPTSKINEFLKEETNGDVHN